MGVRPDGNAEGPSKSEVGNLQISGGGDEEISGDETTALAAEDYHSSDGSSAEEALYGAAIADEDSE